MDQQAIQAGAPEAAALDEEVAPEYEEPADQAPPPPALGWATRLLRLFRLRALAVLVGGIVNFVLRYAGGCAAELNHSMGWAYLAAALLCLVTAAKPRLPALMSVLLAAQQAACIGLALAHQMWQHKCRPLHGSVIATFVAAPALSAIASLWLALTTLTELQHWVLLYVQRAATGAFAVAYLASFFGPYTTSELPWLIAALIFGSLLSVAFWSNAWEAVQLLLPAALQPFADSLAQGGLVADGVAVLAALPNHYAHMILAAAGMAMFELGMIGLARTLKP